VTLRINQPTVHRVPVEVLKFRWCGTLTPASVAGSFKCTACGSRLGARRFGIAWILANDGERSVRLCEDCGVDAEESAATRPESE
jgi:hypothetical protein